MIPATVRRKWRRTVAEVRYGFNGKLTRRSSRLALRFLGVLVILAMIITFHDSRKPEQDRVIRSEIVRGSLTRRSTAKNTDPRQWPGWKGINTIFAFGDSQTDTGFNLRGPQPDDENPIGNPGWPGRTSSYRANYLGHMTGTFNQSFIRTYNMANKLSPFFHNTDRMKLPNFGDQIEEKFLRRYGPSTKMTARSGGKGFWTQRDTLFVLYVGADDIMQQFHDELNQLGSSGLEANLEAYWNGIEKLYDSGARNFLFIGYPQLENAPGIKDFGETVGEGKAYWRLGSGIVQYNARLAFMAHKFGEKHADANVFVFNTHKVSLTVRLEPTRYEETQYYTHLFGYCFPYADDTWWVDTDKVFVAGCSGGLANYFWRDEFHYSEPFQKLIARLAIEMMGDKDNRLPQEFY